METCLRVTNRLKNMVAHSYSDGVLIVSSRNKIMVIEDLEHPKPKIIKKIPFPNFQKLIKIRTIDRILRNDIRLVYRCKNGFYLVCNRKGWWYVDDYQELNNIPQLSGSLPLARGICKSKKKYYICCWLFPKL